jgi:hypothetical protein
MPIKTVPAFGWSRCAQLSNGHAELLVTLEVGPRVLSYRTVGGENVLRVDEADAGKSGEKEFKGRGGHRLWVSPETERTYTPDNGPVDFQAREPNAGVFVTPSSDPWRIRKELSISLGTDNTSVMLAHKLTNESREPVTIASWALTIMTPGGYEIIPQPPLGEHGNEFLPNRVIVPWTYTDFSDPRWKFGRRFFLLTPEVGGPPTKLGFAHRPRWVGWVRGDTLFIKVFEYEDGQMYPDLGCNFETFSKSDFLELESLSPLRKLSPGESVSHTEMWHLFSGVKAPDPSDEAALERWLAPFLSLAGIV